MAISQMAKVMIVSHRTEAAELLEALQREGICQVLNAEEAMVSKDWPDLVAAAERPRELEELLGRLGRSITFLKGYTKAEKGLLAGILAPRTVIDRQWYQRVVSDEQILKIIDECEHTEKTIDRLGSECEKMEATLGELRPWAALESAVEEIGAFRQATSFAGLMPSRVFEQTKEQMGELGAAVEVVGTANNKYACIIVCMKENLSEVQKLLRTAEFEAVSFEGPRLGAGAPERMRGTAAELIEHYQKELAERKKALAEQHEKAESLSKELLSVQILADHYDNLFNREKTKGSAPATEQTVILEGWVRRKDYGRLEKTVSGFGASSLSRIDPAEGEEIPVEIENKGLIKPFEVITRLYGMPRHFEVDPTGFLAPFFALFFALCLTDAGYGLIIIALMIFFIKKMQGDKKLLWMLGICSAATIVAGALTGGWFGDAVQKFIPSLGPVREKMMWFDPFEKPMIFFGLSLAVGYFQILTGLAIAFTHNLKRRNYVAAACDQLTWLVMLNCIVIFLASKSGYAPAEVGKFCGWLALIPAGTILLFSQREGPVAGRIGMGMYNLFSTIFYIGDVLSYLRLMALGMVTAGLAMATNVIAKIALDIPYGVGIIVMVLVLVGGHGFNLAISGLSAFVHTLRLQYVEFFPKFFEGGGRAFVPLSKEYKHIYIKK